MPYTITSVTTKPTRKFTNPISTFSYYSIKREAFTGYRLIRKENKAFLIADKEKALVDYLYFLSLGKRGENERLDLAGRNQTTELNVRREYFQHLFLSYFYKQNEAKNLLRKNSR